MRTPTERLEKSRRRRLAWILAAVFSVAMVMGPGPGLYLINPDPADAEARFTIAGFPVIYAWAIFWFFIQAAVVLIAYTKLWRDDAGASPPSAS